MGRTVRRRTPTCATPSRSTRRIPPTRAQWATIGSEFALDVPPRRALLRFDGIEGAADIWLNGVLLGSTRGSRLPADFAVGDLLLAGEPNILVVRVHQFSAASYLEDQDCWWLPGIFRAVTLRERPVGGIDDVHVTAAWTDGVATLRVDVETTADAVTIELVELGLTVPAGETVPVPGASPWSAEAPVLYTLRVRTPAETVETAIGFRSVAIVDGVFTVNGAPVQLRGVNRHEHHPVFGRHVPRAVVEAELALMKRSNINAIRTSHYPPDPLLLDLADRLGFWVIDEADVETHGFGPGGTWRDNPHAVRLGGRVARPGGADGGARPEPSLHRAVVAGQ